MYRLAEEDPEDPLDPLVPEPFEDPDGMVSTSPSTIRLVAFRSFAESNAESFTPCRRAIRSSTSPSFTV